MRAKKTKVEENKNSGTSQIDELKLQLARTLADFDNYKKRTEAEKTIWFRVSAGRVVAKFLSVMDMLVSAQQHLNDPGLAIILGEFKKAAEEEGFSEIPIETGLTVFDANTMEATETVVTDESEKNNKVAEVILSGWKARETDSPEDFVIRHAKVKVFLAKVEN
jgi:molecular chaperone GrpE